MKVEDVFYYLVFTLGVLGSTAFVVLVIALAAIMVKVAFS